MAFHQFYTKADYKGQFNSMHMHVLQGEALVVYIYRKKKKRRDDLKRVGGLLRAVRLLCHILQSRALCNKVEMLE
jgi:hypothetical protein